MQSKEQSLKIIASKLTGLKNIPQDEDSLLAIIADAIPEHNSPKEANTKKAKN